MGLYARDTLVSSERSKAEIEKTLRRYGAEEFVSGWDKEKAVVMFRMNNRRIKFILPMPDKNDFRTTASGHERHNESSIEQAWEQAGRQRWRALSLVIKAKLEAVESGVTEFQTEFLAHILLPNGQTYGDFAVPQIASVYEHKKMPPLLGDGK